LCRYGDRRIWKERSGAWYVGPDEPDPKEPEEPEVAEEPEPETPEKQTEHNSTISGAEHNRLFHYGFPLLRMLPKMHGWKNSEIWKSIL
jgi:hypothetical protein